MRNIILPFFDYFSWVAFIKNKLPGLIILLFFSSTYLSGQDTLLKNIINFENPIRAIVKDGNSNVYVQTLEGVFLLNKDGFEKTNVKISNFDGIIVHNGKLTSRKTLEKAKIPHKSVSQNYDWQNLLPRSGSLNFCQVIRDKYGQILVSNGTKFLFCFKINNLFERSLPNLSIRGIEEVQDKLFVLSYSGLFMNGNKWTEKLTNSSSNIFRNRDNLYFASTDQVFELHLKTNEIEIISNKKSSFPIGEISCVLFKDSILYIGGFNGLFTLKKSGILIKEMINEEVNNLCYLQNKIFVCTTKGVYTLSKNNFVSEISFPSELQYNDIEERDNKLYAASSKGLWMLEGGRTTINLLKNTLYENIECYAIEIDEVNQLWISTSRGIVRYNTNNASIDVYLPEIEFNKRSSHKNKSKIYFGSTEGLFEFDALDFPVDEIFIKENKEINASYYLNYVLIFILVIGLLILGWFFLRTRYKLNNRINQPLEDLNSSREATFNMENIEVYILNNIKTITAESLREDSGMSKNVFYKVFNQYYDITPKQLIESIRRDHQRRKKSD
jgi:ligand-binding sensor domain-containing protein/AraC-like DNA-binding protein